MLITYTRALLYIWLLRHDTRQLVEETLKFYWWLLELKAAAYYPANSVGMEMVRDQKVRKLLCKIPPLSKNFYRAVDDIEKYWPLNFPKEERELILEKRRKLATVREWLIMYDSSKLNILRDYILLENPTPAAQTFKRKRMPRDKIKD